MTQLDFIEGKEKINSKKKKMKILAFRIILFKKRKLIISKKLEYPTWESGICSKELDITIII